MGKLLVVLGLMLVSLAIVLCGCTTNEIQQKTDDTSKITGTWEAADQTGATGTLIYKFYSNGNYKWYDTENLGGWNFEGTWNWTDGQIVVYQTYPVEQTRYIDYYFTDNDQTLTITLGNEGSMTLTKLQEETDDTSKITGTWEAADQTGATGTLIYKFYSNGNYKWYDTENLGGWNIEGTWSWSEGQIANVQTYPTDKTSSWDYYFTDNDQTLTITLGNEGSMTLTKLQEETDDTSKITGNWSGETPKAPTWIGIFEFYTNGSYHWYDPDDLSGWNFEGTWSWSEGQIANVQTYPADKTSSWDYYFTDNDQTLTITLGNEGTYTLSKI